MFIVFTINFLYKSLFFLINYVFPILNLKLE